MVGVNSPNLHCERLLCKACIGLFFAELLEVWGLIFIWRALSVKEFHKQVPLRHQYTLLMSLAAATRLANLTARLLHQAVKWSQAYLVWHWFKCSAELHQHSHEAEDLAFDMMHICLVTLMTGCQSSGC